jgi:sec-independent protein translocase protein TatA
MMGLDNPLHIAFLLVILLLVFGAKRLPEMGQSLGAGLRGFKDSLTGETHVSQLSSGPEPADGLSANHADAEPKSERSPVRPAA